MTASIRDLARQVLADRASAGCFSVSPLSSETVKRGGQNLSLSQVSPLEIAGNPRSEVFHEGGSEPALMKHRLGRVPGETPPEHSLSILAPAGLAGEWHHGIASLGRENAPCPLFRDWPAVCRSFDQFLAEHAETAVGLGWTTLDLFGVHHLVGSIRGDCAGALTLGRARLVELITPDLIRFVGGLAYRRKHWPAGEVISIWEFGR